MFRKTLLLALLAFSLITTPFASFADEGMWLPGALDKLPQDQLKKRGLLLKPEEIYSTAKVSLKDAVVIIGGGTGTFISPDGLIVTNHHVAFEAITAASSTENNYIENGFLANARAEEIQAKGYTVRITQESRDVTDQILAAVTPGMSDAERNRAVAGKQRDLAREFSKDGLVAQIVEAYGGAQYHLYIYQQLNDVRLVYAPPKAIGYFGGDPDNFEWPRHCGDFSFMRAYVAPDGKAAGFNKDNVPFKPKKFLALDASGVKEGDFTMVLGYPGATYRWRESYSVDYNQNVRLPFLVDTLNEQINVLTEAGNRDPVLKIKYADDIFSLSNSAKAFDGTVKGLRRSGAIERKRAEEATFNKWLDGNPALKEKYGKLLPQIADLYADLNSYGAKEQALSGLLGSGTLIFAVSTAYRRALDQEKPANERNPQFSDAALPQVLGFFQNAWKERDAAVDQQRFQAGLNRLSQLPANQKSSAVEPFFAGKTGVERQQAETDFARKAIAETPLKSFDELSKLFKMPASELRASNEPLVKLAAAVVDETAPLAKKQEAFNTAIPKARADYVRALLDWKKGPQYPDANRTLRFTYGEVKSYKPRDAVSYDWQTSLSGVIEKDTGVEPFNVPAKLKELSAKKDFGPYLDTRLKDVPVAFLTTNDITGGNSGSAVLNGRGEVIGLAFDGNFEGLGGDYNYDITSNRCLVVDIRYVLFITEKFAGADYLFKEMTIKRGKAMAASR
ncbi:MAG: S46 family peptidase [Acidobacteria bacterium]|nr:S46 family peptidase [Acidobacteriota bacterium]MBI3425366.1 S46 family peptidase [Acidobacteriota bacterium]